MGQYFLICNMDKKEFLSSGWFGHGDKLGAIGRTGEGVMTGLVILLACSGSDLYSSGPIYGRWAGDRIAIVGDYYQGIIAEQAFEVNTWASIAQQEEGWVDISEHVRRTLEEDWRLQLPPALNDEADPRSRLHPDGTITAIPRPIYDANTGTWIEPGGGAV